MLDNRDMNVAIPARLDAVVEESLKSVSLLHRRKMRKRVATSLGAFFAAVAAVGVLGAANPALASQIPVIGRLFQTVNEDAKAYGGQHLDELPQIQVVEESAPAGESGAVVTVSRAYSDGHDIQMALTLDTPSEWKERFQEIYAQLGAKSTVEINGISIQPAYGFSMNGFRQEDGMNVATLRIVLPPELEGQERYEVSLHLAGLVGWNGWGEEYDTIDLPDEFDINTTVQADLSHEISFTSDAQDNGAKVLAVSATPSRTVLTIQQPYWGERPGDSGEYSYSAGYPRLYTESGEELQMDWNSTRDKGLYDPQAKDTQTATLYFDGAPTGESRVVLKFWEGYNDGDVLAQFVIHLENQTVTPASR